MWYSACFFPQPIGSFSAPPFPFPTPSLCLPVVRRLRVDFRAFVFTAFTTPSGDITYSFGRYTLTWNRISIHTAKSTHWIQLYLESDHSLIVDHTIYPYNSPDRLTYFYVEPYIHPVSPPGYTLQTSLILLSDISPTFFQPSHLFDSCCSNVFCEKSATLWLVYTPYFDGSVALWQF